jgi:hypothetical protein
MYRNQCYIRGQCTFDCNHGVKHGDLPRYIYLDKDDILIVEPYEAVEFYANTNCAVLTIKTVSVPSDKILC